MNKNNNYLSKTLLCLAVGGGLTYIRKFKNNTEDNNNNIATIFDKKKVNNNPIIYTKEERKDIFNEFIKSKKVKSNSNKSVSEKEQITSIQNNTEIKLNNTEITLNNTGITSNNKIYTITDNELNINNNENIYRFYTNKDCYYKIKIIIEDEKENFSISFNNFNHKIENNIIFDNIIFDNPYQVLEIKNNNSLVKISIKEYPIKENLINNINKGIIIINSYPYFLNNNSLPDFIEKEQF